MMNNTQAIGRFVIDARAHEYRDGSGWSADFSIEEHDRSGVTDTMFYLQERFQSRDSAIAAALAEGRRKIAEGFSPNLEIQADIENASKLPMTYRHGLGHQSDDVAIGPGDGPVKVWGPDNPEDRYE